MESAETLAARYLAQNRTVDVGRCISRGITLVTGNLGLVVGSALVAFAVMLGLGMVPILGWIAAFVVNPALFAGLYLILIKRLRGQDAVVGDLFAPFSGSILNLALASLISTVLIGIGMFFLILPGIYLAVGYVFALPLVADKNLEFWTAMELSRRVVHKHWFSTFALIIVGALVAMLGFLALVIGIIVTAPIFLASLAVAYDDLFGDAPAAAVSTV